MLDYQTLDSIADAYTPSLLATCLFLILQTLVQKNRRKATSQVTLLVYGISLTYGLMFLDHALQIWPSFKLDYSTHSAIALVLVAFLMEHLKSIRFFWLGSLMAYFLLMLYQQYHSVADIISTSLVMAVLLLPVSHKLSVTFNASPTDKL